MTPDEPTEQDLPLRLAGWLADVLPAVENVSVRSLERARQGNAATTLHVEAEWSEGGDAEVHRLVLRLEPEGDSLFLGADLTVPYRVMEILATDPTVPVPRLVGFESSPGVLGAPFFVMHHTAGRPPADAPCYHAVGWLRDLAPADRGRVWRNGLDVLARVHAIDPARFGFLEPAGLDRYVRWVEDWYRWALDGRAQPFLDDVLDRLRRGQPTDPPVRLAWGDARPGNILFTDDLAVGAVLDWEMATLGPAELDLGWWLLHDRFWATLHGVAPLAGLPSRAETIAHYEERAGRPVTDIDWYEAFAAFRMAVVQMRSSTRRAGGVLPVLPVTTSARLAAELTGVEIQEEGASR